MKAEKILALAAAVMLLLAIPSIWPYGYFVILRWVVAGSAAYIAYLAYEANRTAWITPSFRSTSQKRYGLL